MMTQFRQFSTYFNMLGAIILALAVVVLIAFLTGCIHNPAYTTQQNLILTTDKSIGVLAQINKGVASSTVSLNAALLLPNEIAREILGYNHEVDGVITLCNSALTSGASPAVITAQLLDALKSIQQLPPGVQTFVTTPATRQEVITLVSLLTSVVSLVRGLISSGASTAPVLPVPPPSTNKTAPTKSKPGAKQTISSWYDLSPMPLQVRLDSSHEYHDCSVILLDLKGEAN